MKPLPLALTLALLTAPYTHADELLGDCPARDAFPAQMQHDCTVYRALKAHGGGSDHDALQRNCKGQICTYRQPPLRGEVEYSTPFGSWVVVYTRPYYAD